MISLAMPLKLRFLEFRGSRYPAALWYKRLYETAN